MLTGTFVCVCTFTSSSGDNRMSVSHTITRIIRKGTNFFFMLPLQMLST